MSVWLIEPRDPLIFRDGRPFNPTPGARAISLPFPYPSTLAGAVRTRVGQNENGVFDKD
ncbi:MAG TPA: type III-B CRISPR module-associated Cmr3 family protein, partial [Anaerolineae bacterium]|nr:type III-B CRISPR module-associated Cmr3 family protein [Anaerolineae bacterium]